MSDNTMYDGPVFYDVLYDKATATWLENGKRQFKERVMPRLIAEVSQTIDALTARAYEFGLRDGFTQGVAAEAKRRDG